MNKVNFLLIVFFLSAISISYAQKPNKLSNALAKRVLDKDVHENFTVWIYFTDKGENLDQKLTLAKQSLGERSLERRKRSLKNKDLVTFYDIPVLEAYAQEVSPFLTKLRHQSKWLNAVSAIVSKTNLQEITALGFVKSIDIVQQGKRNNEPLDSKETLNNPVDKTAVYDLDYGASLAQLEQINVPLVHDLGYSGSGIIICVLDAGFRIIDTHPAFSNIDILAAYDFVNDDDNVDNQPDDMGSGSHGTSTLSTIGGFSEGNLIGPAYNATYLLAKTENTDSETPVEEDNWVAAAEWAEALGADITSTSLSYLGFDDGSGYGPADLDGNTATITIAGDIMASLGVLVVNSAGNYGGGATTIGAPADGNEILAIGAVDASGNKAGFSSVGPTADGRIKPDVMAMGVSVFVANQNGNYSYSNGTSFSCPLVAGAAALLWEMVPTATNMEIFEALKMSADNAATPNNSYGWGIINLYTAFEYLTIQDAESPVAMCQNAIAELGIDGTYNLEAYMIDNGSTDNIGIASYTLDFNTLTCAELGNLNVTLTVADPTGNESSCSAIVTVVDNMPPIVLTQDITIDLNGAASISITPSQVDAGSTDNCGIANLSLDEDTFTAVGDYTVSLSVEDVHGNLSVGSAIVSVINSTVSTADKDFADNLIVYPNPANDKVYLEFDHNRITSVDISIYNLTGKLIKTINAYHSHDLISLSGMANGLYIFKVENERKAHFVKVVVHYTGNS